MFEVIFKNGKFYLNKKIFRRRKLKYQFLEIRLANETFAGHFLFVLILQDRLEQILYRFLLQIVVSWLFYCNVCSVVNKC